MYTVTNLSLCSVFAERLFQHITGDRVNGDESMIAAARMLLHPRGQKLQFRFYDLDGDFDDINDFVREVENDTLAFFTTTKESDIEEFSAPAGYTFLEVPSRFYTNCNKQGAMERKVRIFCNPDEHKTICFIYRLRTPLFHALVGGLSMLVPWAFSEHPITQEEMQLMLKVADPKSSLEDFVKAADEFAKQFDLQGEAKRYYLDGFEQSAITSKIRSARARVDEVALKIQRIHSELSRYYSDLEGYRLELFGLENAPQEQGSELMNYFLQNKSVYVMDGCSGEEVNFVVTGYMSLFDTAMYEEIRDNPESYLYRAYARTAGDQPVMLSEEDYLLLMDGLFAEGSIRLKMCSAWYLTTSDIVMRQHYSYPDTFKDMLPNPHLDRYGCWGSWHEHITEALNRYDYIAIMDLVCAENTNINLVDSVVIPNEFIPKILTNPNRIIELPDGTSVTTVEAVQWLRSHE